MTDPELLNFINELETDDNMMPRFKAGVEGAKIFIQANAYANGETKAKPTRMQMANAAWQMKFFLGIHEKTEKKALDA